MIRGWQRTATGRCITRTWSSTSAPFHCWWGWQSPRTGGRPGARRPRSRRLLATSSGTWRTKMPWSLQDPATCTTPGMTSPRRLTRRLGRSPSSAACRWPIPAMAVAAGRSTTPTRRSCFRSIPPSRRIARSTSTSARCRWQRRMGPCTRRPSSSAPTTRPARLRRRSPKRNGSSRHTMVGRLFPRK